MKSPSLRGAPGRNERLCVKGEEVTEKRLKKIPRDITDLTLIHPSPEAVKAVPNWIESLTLALDPLTPSAIGAMAAPMAREYFFLGPCAAVANVPASLTTLKLRRMPAEAVKAVKENIKILKLDRMSDKAAKYIPSSVTDLTLIQMTPSAVAALRDRPNIKTLRLVPMTPEAVAAVTGDVALELERMDRDAVASVPEDISTVTLYSASSDEESAAEVAAVPKHIKWLSLPYASYAQIAAVPKHIYCLSLQNVSAAQIAAIPRTSDFSCSATYLLLKSPLCLSTSNTFISAV